MAHDSVSVSGFVFTVVHTPPSTPPLSSSSHSVFSQPLLSPRIIQIYTLDLAIRRPRLPLAYLLHSLIKFFLPEIKPPLDLVCGVCGVLEHVWRHSSLFLREQQGETFDGVFGPAHRAAIRDRASTRSQILPNLSQMPALPHALCRLCPANQVRAPAPVCARERTHMPAHTHHMSPARRARAAAQSSSSGGNTSACLISSACSPSSCNDAKSWSLSV